MHVDKKLQNWEEHSGAYAWPLFWIACKAAKIGTYIKTNLRSSKGKVCLNMY